MSLGEKYDIETFAVMDRSLRADSNCVDIGSHSGEILQEMLRRSPQGRHSAFEPLPQFYQSLRERFRDNDNVAIYCVALSDRIGEATFQHVVTNPAYSGLRRRRYDRPDERVEEITVRTAPLDSILPPSLDIHFIKIDVEGAELQVLRGAVGTLRRCRPLIVFEHGLGAADYYGTASENVYDLLSAECGLDISLIESWLANAPPLSRQAFSEQFHSGANYYFLAHPSAGSRP